MMTRPQKTYTHVFGITLTATTATIAATVTNSGVTLNNGPDGNLIAEKTYEIIGILPGRASADLKAIWLQHPDWTTVPGVPVFNTDGGQVLGPKWMYEEWTDIYSFVGKTPPTPFLYTITGGALPQFTVLVGQVD